MSQLFAKFEKPLVDATGIIQPRATVTVFNTGTLDKPNLYKYRDGSLALSNPFVASSNGIVKFFVASGTYDILIELGDKQYVLGQESIVDFDTFMNNIQFYKDDLIYRKDSNLNSVFAISNSSIISIEEFTIRGNGVVDTISKNSTLSPLPIYTSNNPPPGLDALLIYNTATKEFRYGFYSESITLPELILGGFSINDTTFEYLTFSIWDTSFRPVADPRQMVFNSNYSIWVDVYLYDTNYNAPRIYSTSNETIKTFSTLTSVLLETIPMGKRMPTLGELVNSSTGTENSTEITPVTLTGYINNRQSSIGVNQATGCLYTWSQEGYLYGSGLHDDLKSYNEITQEVGAIRLVSELSR